MDEQQMRKAEQRLVQAVNAFDTASVATPTPQYVQAVSALLLFGQLEKMDLVLWRIFSEIEDLREDMEPERSNE